MLFLNYNVVMVGLAFMAATAGSVVGSPSSLESRQLLTCINECDSPGAACGSAADGCTCVGVAGELPLAIGVGDSALSHDCGS